MLIEFHYLIIIILIGVIPLALFLSNLITRNKQYKLYKSYLGITLTIIILGIVTLIFSTISHTIIEVTLDNNNHLIHKRSTLIGNKTFTINDKKVVNTSDLIKYDLLIINYTDRELTITNVVYTSNYNSNTYEPESDYYIPSFSYFSLNKGIRFFFDYNKPPKMIQVKSYEDPKKEYWLKEYLK